MSEPAQSTTIFKSRIFWVNLLSAVLELAQLFTGTNLIPPGYLTIGVNGLNIVLRRLTAGEVHVVTPHDVTPQGEATCSDQTSKTPAS